MRTLLVLLAVAMSFVAHARTIYYADWIDSAHAATTQGDHAKAQGFYLKAFQRRPPLAKHALECARISWLLLDTGTTQVYVDHSLDLGITGPEVAADSVLKQFWVSGSAATSKALWSTYRTMEIPELIPIRITDPPDLLALFPHYFSEEVVPSAVRRTQRPPRIVLRMFHPADGENSGASLGGPVMRNGIKAELEGMFRADQDIRKNLNWEKADSPDSLLRRSVWEPVEAQDQRHYDRVLEIIRDHGVPSVHQVGLTGDKMIFFAFIHAGLPERITPWILQLRASVEKGDSPGTWYAYVIDRVMVATTKVTMFGTTGYIDWSDAITYFDTVVPEQTELLRESIGLPQMGRNSW